MDLFLFLFFKKKNYTKICLPNVTVDIPRKTLLGMFGKSPSNEN